MVHRGIDLSTGETVAVKISSSFGSQLGERFQQEANCLATIAHPAIVRYIAHGKTSQSEHYLVMEWLSGETLEDRLARGPINLGATIQMIRRVAEALAIAHQHGVIHRDIKPANIFLPEKDMSKIKLLDFGIARRLFDPPALRLTQAGSALGTPMYMSPEQAQGSLDVDARADIFSLGCVFFECLTGTPPFMADSTTGTLARIATEETIDVDARCTGVPKSVTELLRRMLAKRADDRPATMSDVLGGLGRLTGELRNTGVIAITRKERTAPHGASPLITTGERRLVSVIVVSPRKSYATPPHLDRSATLSDLGNLLARNLSDAEADQERMDALSRDVAAFGAQLHYLANRSLVVTLIGEVQSTPLDLAMRAARCALKLKFARPDSTMGISLGHAIRDQEWRTGELINRAIRLLSTQHLGAIHVEPEIKRLLDARFEIVFEPDGRARLLFEKGLRDVPRTVLGREVPCLGREREVRELEGFFEACTEESEAQVVVMSGAAGCGKSRVAHEFLERLRDSGEGFELLIGRGDPMRTNVSLGLISQALRGAAGISGTETDEVQRKRLFAHTSRFLPSKTAATTVAFLGEIANIPFPDDELPQLQAARRDARLMADQTVAAWMDWLEAEAEHHPVFVLLEDLHWCDIPSVNYMDSAMRILRDKPVMLLALARPEVDERFYGLWRDRRVQRISLGPLGKRAGEDMIRRVLGETAPDKIAWLLDHAQGNPFYLEELCRALALSGDVSAIPDTVLGTVQVRFDAIGEGCKLVLRAASIFGQSFLAAGVKALVGDMHDEDVDRWLEILVDKEILFSRPLGSVRQHVFRHALLHQAAYAMLTPKDEVSGHYMAADFLEKSGEREAIILADHYEKGEQPGHAIRWLRVAANQAMEVDDLAAALTRVERGVRLGAQGDDLAELRVVESEARFWKGEYVEAERAAREGRAGSNATIALRAMSALLDALGHQARFDEIALLSKEIGERPADADLLNSWLNCKYNSAAYLAIAGKKEARTEILELLAAERANLDSILIGRIETTTAHIAHSTGKPVEFARGFLRASEFFERAGHRRAGTESLANASAALAELGRLEEAEEHIRKVCAAADRLGLNHVLGGSLQMLANILAYRGALDEARTIGKRALELTTKQNDNYFRGFAELCLSVIEFLAADFRCAEEHAHNALATFENNVSFRPFAGALLARALLAQQRRVEALAVAKSAYSQLKELGGVPEGEAYIRLAYAECLAISDAPLASSVLNDAIEWLLRRADTIEDPQWRSSFLTRIPEYRRIFELADQIGLSYPRLQ
jgi:tetratricopeptide (TPR) repeat protein